MRQSRLRRFLLLFADCTEPWAPAFARDTDTERIRRRSWQIPQPPLGETKGGYGDGHGNGDEDGGFRRGRSHPTDENRWWSVAISSVAHGAGTARLACRLPPGGAWQSRQSLGDRARCRPKLRIHGSPVSVRRDSGCAGLIPLASVVIMRHA